jgi:hypothetical protein
VEDEPKASEMTEFGKELWMIMQDKEPYNRASIAKLVGRRTGWQLSRKAVSNWLKGEREAPRELVPAAVVALGLDKETARRLEHLYFYGQPGLPAALRLAAEQQGALSMTEENERKIAEVQREWEERNAGLGGAREADNRRA